MNAALDMVVGMSRSWVALYTLGLPAELRIARRLEIDCDFWEQRQLAGFMREPPLGTAAEIAARTVLGMLSDITWRVQAGLSARSDRSPKMNQSLTMRALGLLGLVVAAFPVVTGVIVIAGLGGGDETDEDVLRIMWGTAAMLGGAAMAAGLLLSLRRRWLGVGLVVAGTVAISATWYWVAPFTVPIGLALAAIAYFRGRPALRRPEAGNAGRS